MSPQPRFEAEFGRGPIEKVRSTPGAWQRLGDRLSEDVRLSAKVEHHRRFDVYEDDVGDLYVRAIGRFLPELLRIRVNDGTLRVSHVELTDHDGGWMISSRLRVVDNR